MVDMYKLSANSKQLDVAYSYEYAIELAKQWSVIFDELCVSIFWIDSPRKSDHYMIGCAFNGEFHKTV